MFSKGKKRKYSTSFWWKFRENASYSGFFFFWNCVFISWIFWVISFSSKKSIKFFFQPWKVLPFDKLYFSFLFFFLLFILILEFTLSQVNENYKFNPNAFCPISLQNFDLLSSFNIFFGVLLLQQKKLFGLKKARSMNLLQSSLFISLNSLMSPRILKSWFCIAYLLYSGKNGTFFKDYSPIVLTVCLAL